jgi:hypothetical protein
MMLPSTALLDPQKPPTTPPVYDIPPVVSSRPRRRPFRTLAARFALHRQTHREEPA